MQTPEERRARQAAHMRAWRERHPEYVAYMRAWRAGHQEYLRATKKVWYALHREAHIARAILFQKTHPPTLEASALKTARRYARKRGLPDTLTLPQWNAIKTAYGFKCAYCGKKPKILSKDHFIPLVQGGGTTPDNIVPACLSCNSAKQDRSPVRVPALRLLL